MKTQHDFDEVMDSESRLNSAQISEQVSGGELNSWRRGFTPQAEIWNGRMASVGLILGLFVLILAKNLFGGKYFFL